MVLQNKSQKKLVHFAYLIIVAGLAACIPGVAPREIPSPSPTLPVRPVQSVTSNILAQYYLPSYYQPDYLNIVEASKQETEGLLIYAIMSAQNWAPVIEAFNAHYPWIKVVTYDVSSFEAFDLYYFQSTENIRTADLVISSAMDAWQTFIAKGELSTYSSREDAYIPTWGRLAPGVYAASGDPMLIIYNKNLVMDPPNSLESLKALIDNDPNTYIDKITTYDADQNATGFAVNWFWLKTTGGRGWETLTSFGIKHPLFKSSADEMVDAVVSGEASLGYFVSSMSVFPRLDEETNLGWSYIHDGQPILVRAMGITQKSHSPNSAKLMVDFILSQEGQLSLGKGGLTPYRSDITNISAFHLVKIANEVGEQNLIFFSLDPELLDQAKKNEFLDRWKQIMGKQ
jgi:iron(III) transport system substrate-binding protein